jgi:hypothetical protein
MIKTKEEAITDMLTSYQKLNSLRKDDETMAAYRVEEPVCTKAEIKRQGVIYISGDTRDPNFWKVVRNIEVIDNESNDEFQCDESALTLQRDLIDKGILGWVNLALIGADEFQEELTRFGVEAMEAGYIPVYWNWCQDYWMIDSSVKYYHKCKFSGCNIPVSAVVGLPSKEMCKTEEGFLKAISTKLEEIVHLDGDMITGFRVDFAEQVSEGSVGIVIITDCSGIAMAFETYSRYFLNMAINHIANILSVL